MALLVTNPAEDTLEIWMDGKFLAGWKNPVWDSRTKAIVSNMLETAVEHGKDLKAHEIRLAIGVLK